MATAHVPQSPRTPRTDDPQPSRDDTRRRHLRVVRPDEGRGLRFRLTPVASLGLIVLLFAALFAVAVSHALLIEGQAQLDRLDAEAAEQQARYERLRVDVAELESPERILADARALGMVPADDVQWLTPEKPVAGGGGASEVETSGTSWEEVKPYVGSTP
jgi:cell division protein FtsL